MEDKKIKASVIYQLQVHTQHKNDPLCCWCIEVCTVHACVHMNVLSPAQTCRHGSSSKSSVGWSDCAKITATGNLHRSSILM